MRFRRPLAVVLAVLMLSALGALAVQAVSQEAPRAPVVPDTESGALQHQAAADAAARAWREDAVLVRLGATEGPQVDGRIDPPFLWDTSGDAFVGNGAALVWTFTYAAREAPGVSFWVSVGGDGSLLYARELPDPFWCCVEYVTPVAAEHHGDPTVSHSSTSSYEPRAIRASVDAPAAVASVLDRPEFAEFALDHPVFQASVELVPEGPEGRSVWLVGYRTATYFGAGAVVDAATGEVLHVGGWPTREPCCATPPHPPQPPVPPTPPEPCCRPQDFRETYRGTIRDYAFDVSFPVESAPWLAELRVAATVDAPQPEIGGFLLTIVDGHGRTLASAPFSDEVELALAAVPASGGYTALVTREGSVSFFGMPLSPEAPVTLAVEVAYADAPQGRPLEWTFLGRAYPGGEAWSDLRVEGEDWTPMRPVSLALSWHAARPGQALELVVLDSWGNELGSARGDATATGHQQLQLDLPRDARDWCCMAALVRAPQPGIDEVGYELRLVVEPISYDDPPHEVHGSHGH